MSRKKDSPYCYDRAAIRLVLESDGVEAARSRWPRYAVDPIARVLGLLPAYKGRDEWNTAWTPLLGTKPDQVLAAELGISKSTVTVQRQKLGVPLYDTKRWRAEKRAQKLRAIPDAELRDLTQTLLSCKYRVTTAEVAMERRRRGIVLKRQGCRRVVTANAAALRRAAIVGIRAAYPSVTNREIAGVLGVTTQYVQMVVASDLMEQAS